jgi:hypothetical protein
MGAPCSDSHTPILPHAKMDWLNKLFKPSASSAREDTNVLWLYVQCSRCGAPLAVRVNRNSEVSHDYESGGYVLRKEMMDGKCFQLMYAELHLDARGQVVSQNIDRGKFLTREEYETLKRMESG